MNESKSVQISSAAALRSYTDPRFKTMRVSANLFLPLRKETAALYGILPGVVTRATREYPTFAALNSRLSELYGASLSTSVRKLGGFQCLTLSASGISSRFAFGGDDMFLELSQLLFSAMFSPLKDENGMFPRDHFLQEQRQLLEWKDAEFNDKIAYAHRRCEELLFAGKDAGIDRYGSREDVAALRWEELPSRWEEVLSSARYEVFALGDCQPDPDLFRDRFAGLGSPRELSILPYEEPPEVRRVTEEQPLAQSKLSLAFRTDSGPDERLLFHLMSAVLGGVPSSKLFQNVREKMGLCYYCSSQYSSLNRAFYVESGVETENTEKAEKAILAQLDALCAGDITEDELLSAKLSLCSSYRSVGDSLHAVEGWHLSQAFSERRITPAQAIEQVMRYTRAEVAAAARKVKLSVVYCLKGREDG